LFDDDDQDCIKFGQKLEGPSPPKKKKIGGPKTSKITARFYATLRLEREYIRNATRCIVERETALQTAVTPAHCNTNRLQTAKKIAPEFRLAQRAAITLGIPSHFSFDCVDDSGIDGVQRRGSSSVPPPVINQELTYKFKTLDRWILWSQMSVQGRI